MDSVIPIALMPRLRVLPCSDFQHGYLHKPTRTIAIPTRRNPHAIKKMARPSFSSPSKLLMVTSTNHQWDRRLAPCYRQKQAADLEPCGERQSLRRLERCLWPLRVPDIPPTI